VPHRGLRAGAGLLHCLFFFLLLPRAAAAVPEIHVACDAGDLARVLAHPHERIEIAAEVRYGGETWEDATLALRGDTSRDAPKKSFRLSFPGRPFVRGEDAVLLNAEYGDPSYLHTYLFSRIMSEIGRPCFDAEHVRLHVNGAFYGLYVRVEKVGGLFLARRGMDPDGSLYKAALDGACLSPWDDLRVHWEKRNDDGDREDLARLIAGLNDTPDGGYRAFAGAVFDYAEMIDAIAVNMLTANGSTYYHNYFMYRDTYGTGRWTMLPWDVDKTFWSYGLNHAYHRSSGSWTPDNPFLERAVLDGGILADVRSRVAGLAESCFSPDRLGPLIDSLAAELAPSVEEDALDNIRALDVWLAWIDLEKDFIARRPGNILEQIDHAPRSFRVHPIPDAVTGPVTFRWTRSADPDGDPVQYLLKYSTDPLFPGPETVFVTGIEDTFHVVATPPPEGIYYWKVTASSGPHPAEGYDTWNVLTVRRGTALPAEITENLRLDAAGSPYETAGDLVVPEGMALEAGPGVEIRLAGSARIVARGRLALQGTAGEPVRLRREAGGSGTAILVTGPKAEGTIRCVVFDGPPAPAVSARDGARLAVEECAFDAPADSAAVVASGAGEVAVRRCRFLSTGGGVAIGGGTAGALIERCVFDSCRRFAVSLDEGSSAVLSSNLFTDTPAAVLADGGAFAFIDRATFFRNGLAVTAGLSSAAAVTSSIFAGSGSATGGPGRIDIAYSLSDGRLLDGDGNLFGDPRFADPENGGFGLGLDSPCLNAGDPNGPPDPDGTTADMGAFTFVLDAGGEAVINEIHYRTGPGADPEDWVELHNPGDAPLDLSGWMLLDGDDDHVYAVPVGTMVEPGGFIVLCRDVEAFRAVYPNVGSAVGDLGFGLSSDGEQVRLHDRSGAPVDSVRYDDRVPWPEEADGRGPSLELVHPALDNADPRHWAASTGRGSPGAVNGAFRELPPGSFLGKAPLRLSLRPNPFRGASRITYRVPSTGRVVLRIYDVSGRRVATPVDGILAAGLHEASWIPEKGGSGAYFCRMTLDGRLVATGKALRLE
jgi:hypothetical protein